MPVLKHRYAFPRGSVGTRRHPAAGFTLLEMVLVLFLMALVASAGLMLTEGVEDQAKYDETKRRMEMIRKAIVGDPTRTVNGSPEISGFVADMGRLPGCIRELLEPIDCEDSPNDLPAWQEDENTYVWSGWRGPYIAVLPDQDGVRRFRDGYGNVYIDDEDEDAQNYGWIWKLYDRDGEVLTVTETSTNPAAFIRLKSKGFDGQDGSSDDYPNGSIDTVAPLVGPRDYQVELDNWSGRILFINRTANPVPPEPTDSLDLKLRLYYPDGNGSVAVAESDPFTLSGSNPVLVGQSYYSPVITFSDGKRPALGMHTAKVFCADNTMFSNSCPGESEHDQFGKISMLPFSRSTEFNFIWDIQ